MYISVLFSDSKDGQLSAKINHRWLSDSKNSAPMYVSNDFL